MAHTYQRRLVTTLEAGSNREFTASVSCGLARKSHCMPNLSLV